MTTEIGGRTVRVQRRWWRGGYVFWIPLCDGTVHRGVLLDNDLRTVLKGIEIIIRGLK